MSFFPLRKVPGVSWPEIPLGHAATLWALYLELERTQWLPPAQIVEGQLAQARSLIAHCRENVPYYAEVLRGAGIQAADIRTMDDFRRIPILQRSVYREQFAQFQARALPAGLSLTNKSNTSGTAGNALTVWQTNLVNLWWLACCLRDIQWCNFDPRGSLAGTRTLAAIGIPEGMNGIESPHWNPGLADLLQTGRCFAIDMHQDSRRQLQWLLEVQPDYFLSTPSIAVFLARLLRERRQRVPNLRAIQVISELLSEEDQAYIEASFGVPVKDLYSCVEAGYLASTCPEGHGLHVHAENVLLEVLNERAEPCQPGETGRVVLTTLRNHITPFLRYEISDTATLGPDRCPCGRGLPLLARVHGKVRPLIHMPRGGRKASYQLVHQLLKLKAYQQHQVIQRAVDHFVIRVMPAGQWIPQDAERIERCVQEYVESPVRVEVEVVERLELTVAGKVRDVIVECAERQGEAPAEPLEPHVARARQRLGRSLALPRR